MENNKIKLSKFISLVLRHKPEKIGIVLDKNGWVNVDELIRSINGYKNNSFNLNRDILKEIVEENNKKRFEYKGEGKDLQIRARQGHSVKIDLGYKFSIPPAFLYHGTASRFVDSILKSGIDKRNRHHVHLSKDYEMAISVGSRHGDPYVLKINCKKMVQDGYDFFKTDNDVWLVEGIPAEYIEK